MRFLNHHKLIIHFIVFSLLLIFTGKALFSASENFLLYLYGATVTFVIMTTFFVTFTKYKDPYEVAISKEKNRIGKKLLVSCMVAVKDEKNIIEQCILSLVKQTYKYKEIIFVNDASTDGTDKILNRYARGGANKGYTSKKEHRKEKGSRRSNVYCEGRNFRFFR